MQSRRGLRVWQEIEGMVHGSAAKGGPGMFATLIKLFKNEDGATAIEYGLIAALIAVAAVPCWARSAPISPPPSRRSPTSCKAFRRRSVFNDARQGQGALPGILFLLLASTAHAGLRR